MKIKQSSGFVYILKSGEFMKVGMTTGSLQSRLKNYSTHNPNGVEVVESVFTNNAFSLEQKIQEIFIGFIKLNGTDWVDFDQKIIDEAKKIFIQYRAEKVDVEEINESLPKTQSKMNVPFTQVANCVLNDPNLTARAKGLFAYLYSKPDDWDFNYIRISKDHKESKNTILSAIHELEQYGYLEREKLPSGRMVYILTYDPMPKIRSEQPMTQNPNFGHISNTNITTNNINNNKDISYMPKKVETEEEVVSTPSSDTQNFFSMIIEKGETFQVFVTQMAEKTKFPPAMVASELQHFTLHWTERDKSGTKQRWETEKTFEVKRRLVTWFNNKRTNFGRNKSATINGVENKYQVNFSNKNV